jgi:hypothetical protein
MPVEARIGAFAGHPLARGGATAAFRAGVVASVRSAFESRRYRLGAVIDDSGRFSVGRVRQAMPRPELAATRDAIVDYAARQRRSPKQLVSPALPHRLGAETGSDATLFVAGYGIAGDDAMHYEDFLGALATMQMAVGTVGAVNAPFTDGNAEERLDRAAAYAIEVNDAARTLDEVGRIKATRSPRSQLRLVVTLVDNATGQVLWHSDRTFDEFMDPTKSKDIRWALGIALLRMPRGPARGASRVTASARQ